MPKPTLLQLIRQLPDHMNAAHTIANTPATQHGRQFAAISIRRKQMIFLRRLSKCLGRPAAAAVTWSDIETTLPLSVLLANLVRLIANIAWGRTNRAFRVRSLLAGRIIVQLSHQLGWCPAHLDYHYRLLGRTLNVIGELAPHESMHIPLKRLMTTVVQWLGTFRLGLWCLLKRVAVANVCRVLSCYAKRSPKSEVAQWVHLNNLSYAILNALALPHNGPPVVVLLMMVMTQPSLIVRKARRHSVQPHFPSMYAWFASHQPNGLDRNRMAVVCAMHLFAGHNRHRVEAVKLLLLLSAYSHESVVLALPTVQSAARNHPRFMSAAMHGRLLQLGTNLQRHRTEMRLPADASLTQFRQWARKQRIVPASPPRKRCKGPTACVVNHKHQHIVIF